MVKVKINKVCPFCGEDQATIYDDWEYDAMYVECDRCAARGPRVDTGELMDDFVDVASEEEIDNALRELAAERWDSRFSGPSDEIEALRELERMHE